MKISIVGLGFVGLPLAVTNAKKFTTIAVDNNRNKINDLKKAKINFVEPALGSMLKSALKSGRLEFTTDTDYAVTNTDITFLTVGTPLDKSNQIDLKHIMAASKQVASSIQSKKRFHLLVVKSTLPPLTTDTRIIPTFKDLIKDGRMDVVVNPEFLREGSAVKDLLRPHLIVIGANNKTSRDKLEDYYKIFYDKVPEIIKTSLASAELIKYANNAFLATKISFINSIADICQGIPGSDVNLIASAIGKDPRIGPLFLNAGPGYGGSCLPKDLRGLINHSRNHKKTRFFEAVKKVNDLQPKKIIKMLEEMRMLSRGKTISILGLGFKKGTDDIRDAVSIKIVRALLKSGLRIKVHDPMAISNFEKIFGARIEYFESVVECIRDSECCLILTDWDQYAKIDQSLLQKHMKTARVIDAKRVLEPAKFHSQSFKAIGLGSR